RLAPKRSLQLIVCQPRGCTSTSTREPSMRTRLFSTIACLWLFAASVGHAAIFGIVGGLVEDSQHRPVPQASVTLRAELSSWQEQTQTDADGRFSFPAVPAGAYAVSVTKAGFQTTEQRLVVRSSTTSSLTVV